MLPAKIKTWLAQFRKYYFSYSKGFLHFPYKRHSPEALVDSFKDLPFVKHSVEQQCVATDTPLMEGGFRYRKLEDGCWIIYSKMRYKANVAFDLVYDDAVDTGSDYYMLSLNGVGNRVRIYTPTYEGHFCHPRYSWTLFKPLELDCSVNFKGDDSRFLTLFFNEVWLQENLASSHLYEPSGLGRFLQSSNGHIVWPLSEGDKALHYFGHFDEIMGVNSQAGSVDMLQLKFSVLKLIFNFLELCQEQKIVDRQAALTFDDQTGLSRVENYLNQHLYEKFSGIEFLSEKFGLSKTKLKDDFKSLFGKPVYRYFHERQMALAKELLAGGHVQVKEVAYKLGYENQSKFSAAFKKHHGVLPSDLSACLAASLPPEAG
jgi:AraC-like DNA-binding protein